MRAEGLAFPGPEQALVVFDDARAALAQVGGQSRGPKIFRQPAQIDVIIG